jgi:hypothetical protein
MDVEADLPETEEMSEEGIPGKGMNIVDDNPIILLDTETAVIGPDRPDTIIVIALEIDSRKCWTSPS